MKLLRKILLLFSILSITIFTSCYVEQVNSEDVFEIMKRSAIPFFVLAQFGRWVSLTNEYTPYEITKIEILESSVTNINNQNRYSRASINFTNKINYLPYEYIGNVDIEYLQPVGTNYKLGLQFFTNTDHFNFLISKAKGIGITGKIDIKKGDLSLSLILTNVQYGNFSTYLIVSYLNSIKDVSNVNPLYPNSGGCLKVVGTYNNLDYYVTFKKDNYNVSFAGYTNQIQSIMGSCEANAIVKGIKYDFKLTYNEFEVTIVPKGTSVKLSFLLTNL